MYSLMGAFALLILGLSDEIPWKYVLWTLLVISMFSVMFSGLLEELTSKMRSLMEGNSK